MKTCSKLVRKVHKMLGDIKIDGGDSNFMLGSCFFDNEVICFGVFNDSVDKDCADMLLAEYKKKFHSK